jgi:hypothetical protein
VYSCKPNGDVFGTREPQEVKKGRVPSAAPETRSPEVFRNDRREQFIESVFVVICINENTEEKQLLQKVVTFKVQFLNRYQLNFMDSQLKIIFGLQAVGAFILMMGVIYFVLGVSLVKSAGVAAIATTSIGLWAIIKFKKQLKKSSTESKNSDI